MQKTAKNLAQKIARQMAREPLEVLKTAGSQVTGVEAPMLRENEPQSQQTSGEQGKLIQHQKELQDKMKSTRRMEALARELSDIYKHDIFEDLQAKIAKGIEVSLDDYSELTMEQKQVLRAQMEAVKFQKQQAAYQESRGGFKMPGSKKGRRFGSTQKQEAEKQQTRVEKPVPPSG